MYHYIVGIRQKNLSSQNPGELSVDFIIPFTDKEVNAGELAKAMIDHKIIKTTTKEAFEAVRLTQLAFELTALGYRVRANDILVLKFASEFEIDDESLKMYIKTTPIEELRKARIAL